MKFVDRKSEMETLQNEYRRKGSSLVIMYGRRRVGKTTLISEFIKDKTALFFLPAKKQKLRTEMILKTKPQILLETVF